ncbi:MAG TPA: serine/threonine-protein kinase, partial [Polyangiaceae bacterium]|nr:serine/threonine-protein kinase [Polyangiaceae bacterium]
MTAPQPIEPGVVLLDRYRVDKIVGQGGMGIVAAVWDTELRHHVAFKVLAGIDLNNVQAIERFMREARIAVRLKSEHVVRVMDAGRLPSGTPYMIMELLEGQDLSKQGALPPWTAVDWVLQAIEAIAEAHAQGVIHRDLKPANLFLASRAGAPPIVKVLDFGISKMANVEGDASITGAGAFFGSPRYMSPEQFRSPKLVDARTDVWALGATLYELLTGEPVYSGTLPEIFDAVFHREPLPIHARRPDVPPALEQVIFRCMQKTPDHRYANVAQLAQALAPFGTGEWQRCVERASRLLPGHEVRASAPEVGTAQAPTQHAHVATFAPTQPPTHHALVAPVAPSPGTLAPPDARLARMRIALFVVVPISFVLIVGIVLFVAFPDKWRRVRLHHASVASLAKVSMNATAEKLGEVVHVTPPNRE